MRCDTAYCSYTFHIVDCNWLRRNCHRMLRFLKIKLMLCIFKQIWKTANATEHLHFIAKKTHITMLFKHCCIMRTSRIVITLNEIHQISYCAFLIFAGISSVEYYVNSPFQKKTSVCYQKSFHHKICTSFNFMNSNDNGIHNYLYSTNMYTNIIYCCLWNNSTLFYWNMRW